MPSPAGEDDGIVVGVDEDLRDIVGVARSKRLNLIGIR
jgi:hypothetical protein